MNFNMTVEIQTTVGDQCAYTCRFLRHERRPECTLFQKRLSTVSGGYTLTGYLRCADCKKAEKAAEKANG